MSEKTKLGVESTTMVSVSKDGHFKKHCTVQMGVASTVCPYTVLRPSQLSEEHILNSIMLTEVAKL